MLGTSPTLHPCPCTETHAVEHFTTIVALIGIVIILAAAQS
jgi:hypothetical protein